MTTDTKDYTPRTRSQYADDVYGQLERLKQADSTFTTNRETWDSVIQRERPVVLPPELTGLKQGIDYQSPDGERAIEDMVDVLAVPNTQLSAKSLEPGDRAKKNTSDWLKWAARSHEVQNPANWWGVAVSHDVVRYGVAVMQKCWRPPTDSKSYEGKSQRERLRVRRHPFYWKNPQTLGCFWKDYEGDQDAFFYEFEISVLDANISDSLQRKDGCRPTLDSAGKVGWLSDDSLPDKGNWDKTLKVVIRDARDLDNKQCPVEGCDHFLRKICVYVSESGGSKGASADNLVDEYVSPFPGSSFFVISGRKGNSSNKDRMYRPILFPLFTELVWYNYLITLTTTLARGESDPSKVVINAAKAPPGVAIPENGAGETVRIPRPEEGQIAVVPGQLEAWPTVVSQWLPIAIEESRARLADYKPNRFVLGENFDEAQKGSATSNITATQQARMPFDRVLKQMDNALLKSHEYERHAILYWAATGNEEDFELATSSTEGVTGETVDSGEVVYVNASKLKTKSQLYIQTKSETAAEEAQNQALQLQLLELQAIDWEQFYERTGWADPSGQVARMAKARFAANAAPMLDMLATSYLQKLVEIGLGVSTGIPPAGAAMLGAGPGGDVTLGREQNAAANPSPQETTGRYINTPPIQSPAGGAGART